MKKPISTFAHGVIDYAAAATFPTTPPTQVFSENGRKLA